MRGRIPLVIAVTLGVSACAYNPKKRAAGWLMVDTEHVRLRTTLPSAEAVEIADWLEWRRDLLAGAAFPCTPSDQGSRFSVTVIPTLQFLDTVTRRMTAEPRGWPIHWFPDYGGQLVIGDERVRGSVQEIQHELAHHLLSSCVPHAPPWFQEGLASFLETAHLDKGDLLVGKRRYLVRPWIKTTVGTIDGRTATEVAREDLPPLERIVNLSYKDFSRGDGDEWGGAIADYAMAWALVHFLELGDPDLRSRLQAYTAALRHEEGDPAALFARHFGGVDLEKRLDRYLERDTLRYVRLRVHVPARRPPVVRAMSEAEGHLEWTWLWSGARDMAERRERMDQHLAAAKAEPAFRARAHAFAAAVLWRENDAAGAALEVEQGLREAPDDPALLQADIELRLDRGLDASASAARLRPRAVTADQICAIAAVDLASGNPEEARLAARRGLAMKPSAPSCGRVDRQARTMLRGERTEVRRPTP